MANGAITTKMVNTKSIDNVKHHVFRGTFILLYILYFLLFMGVSFIHVEYVHILALCIHLAICAFLLWRFNPFIDHALRPFDSDIIFASATLLLFNTMSTEVGTDNITKMVSYFQNWLKTRFFSAMGHVQ